MQRKRAAGRDVILEIDWQAPTRYAAGPRRRSASSSRRPPWRRSESVWSPGTKTASRPSKRRLREARAEISHYRDYDYFVVNDDFETTLDDLRAIVRAERLKRLVQSDRRRNLIDDLLS